MWCKKITKKYYCLFLVLSMLLVGCYGYPEVSPKTYEISKSLYSICNQKSTKRLQVVKSIVVTSHKQNEINKNEANWLNEIIELAQNGEWDVASQNARRILEDQTSR